MMLPDREELPALARDEKFNTVGDMISHFFLFFPSMRPLISLCYFLFSLLFKVKNHVLYFFFNCKKNFNSSI